ncbi:5f1b82ae-03a5-467c-b0c4-4f570aabbe96-CDS [Sclerotinia trifoliorum]|uniref:5f1b82ae-03a5-467c-b0c4-4f570aabbe96-CDS n=1 Tax=Sclerotinia trifoliorum TaxID=28548 RepID=A0A8H2W7B7_9HELO|nr:5f1b82ae-03a5-467c-b0c4-4f570aabbe96-CDS [Sclerotinia trifoliorum]
MAAFQKPKQPRRESQPSISHLTSHESMNGIPMTLDTLVLNAGNDTIDWQHLYFGSRLLNSKLRSEHRLECDRLGKGKLAMRRAIKVLGTLSRSQQNDSKVLGAEWSFSLKEIDRLKQQVSGLQSDNSEYSSRMEDLTSSLQKILLRLSEEIGAKTEDLHKKWIELDDKIANILREKQELPDTISKAMMKSMV